MSVQLFPDFIPSMTLTHPGFQFAFPLPFGSVVRDGGVQFIVYSHSATSMRVLLYDKVTDSDPSDVIQLDASQDRWGDVWSAFIPGLTHGQLYHFQADGPHRPEIGLRFDGKARLIDPFAKALAGDFLPAYDGVLRPPKCVVVDESFDWQGDRHVKRELSESIIYEMHVRGFTQSPTSGVKHPGTYLGVIEKIPYLKSLGITAVELMPVHEFPILCWNGTREPRGNYWGYDPMALFAPHRGYAYGKEPGAQVEEFKLMVRELHAAGIEVILDVVFNHTCEGNELGPTISFKGFENPVYYMLDRAGAGYRNYSGCGNTLNGNHPVMRELIFLCLRHWVHNYHVDGFRFDLASILSRDRDGKLVPNPPVVEAIAEDPLLADTKLIAEAWDAAGAYQVGSFSKIRWAEWNGRYRDDLRRFWRGDPYTASSLATRISGSSDLFQASGREPYHSINFVTAHDGFTMNDLVSYSHKHNEANGEQNHDGENNNFSANYGVEGPSESADIECVRLRQIKNMLASMMLSQGVPMMLFGDECRRTQRGNNNAYCQDNSVSWFNWEQIDQHKDLVRFTQGLVQFRRSQPTVRQTAFLTGNSCNPELLPDVSWFSATGEYANWADPSPALVCLLGARPQIAKSRHILMLFNAGVAPREFAFPKTAATIKWRLFVNTAAAAPDDIFPAINGPSPPHSLRVTLPGRCLMAYVSADPPKGSVEKFV